MGDVNFLFLKIVPNEVVKFGIFQGSLPKQKNQPKKSRWKCLLIRWDNFFFRKILAELFSKESTREWSIDQWDYNNCSQA